ncbi:hypothetical protein CDD83_6461 [Cordyceps sp. RAO-2017]|nr:hypothetical protein CDD83_6461 [Cordyceps sp. RAO-2017]
MELTRWSSSLSFVLAAALVSWPAPATGEQVPYVDGLTEGQGFNTFLQTGCQHGAVQVTRPSGEQKTETDQAQVMYTAERISSYEKLVESIEVSAGATVKTLNAEGSVNARFLDRSEFESSFLTYLVKVDVRRQPTTAASYAFQWNQAKAPQQSYCDRFIGGFIEGGALYARVSIVTKDKTKHREVEQSAKAAFKVFSAGVEITQEAKSSFDKVQKNSEISIYLQYVGAPLGSGFKDEVREGDAAEILQLKNTADRFLDAAQSHAWKRYAMLEKYTNIPDFNGRFEPYDYSEATDRSWSVLTDFTKFLGVQKMIRQVPAARFVGGRGTRDEFDTRTSNILAKQRTWVTAVSGEPSEAKRKPTREDPAKLYEEVLSAVRSTPYIAQRLQPDGGPTTDIIDKKLHHRAKKLFDLQAFDFGDIPGTAALRFGKRPDQNRHTCVIGRAMSPGYDVLSELWVFEKAVPGVVNETVAVTAIPMDGSFELSLLPPGAHRLLARASRLFGRQWAAFFEFYVKSA